MSVSGVKVSGKGFNDSTYARSTSGAANGAIGGKGNNAWLNGE